MKWACMCNVDHQNVEAKHVSCRKNWYCWYRTCGKTKPFRIVSTTWTTCGSVANNIQQLLINLLLEFWQEELFGGWAPDQFMVPFMVHLWSEGPNHQAILGIAWPQFHSAYPMGISTLRNIFQAMAMEPKRKVSLPRTSGTCAGAILVRRLQK